MSDLELIKTRDSEKRESKFIGKVNSSVNKIAIDLITHKNDSVGEESKKQTNTNLPKALVSTKANHRTIDNASPYMVHSMKYDMYNEYIIVNNIEIHKESKSVYLTFGFQNISLKPITSVSVGFKCDSVVDEFLETINPFDIDDILVQPNQNYLHEKKVKLTKSKSRKILPYFTRIIFSDGTIVELRDEMSKTAPQIPIQLYEYMPAFYSLASKFFEHPELDAKYLPSNTDDYWYCTCGQLNLYDRCYCCDNLYTDIFGLINKQDLIDEKKRLGNIIM